ncbi:hypothetical protein DAPPUDRAFT_111681 [Daphnia pulex]|uniref:Uncharacterized protein n=1 Tax=Daphnia pulex TaxID=6669 RepID=E9H9Z1_DAPPU|nr:hypothetical protein DAPPUDRAFT_111681 [Daphnia pulex]|eukprot:EFX71487.1 hypothetical protein DAPPUDRAFT_111681 [Daphnia pulex]
MTTNRLASKRLAGDPRENHQLMELMSTKRTEQQWFTAPSGQILENIAQPPRMYRLSAVLMATVQSEAVELMVRCRKRIENRRSRDHSNANSPIREQTLMPLMDLFRVTKTKTTRMKRSIQTNMGGLETLLLETHDVARHHHHATEYE